MSDLFDLPFEDDDAGSRASVFELPFDGRRAADAGDRRRRRRRRAASSPSPS